MNNFIQIIGRLTKDVELKYTQSNKPVTDFNLAVNRNFKNKNGEYDTDFIPVVMWGRNSEVLNMYCKKGDLIGVAGRLQIDKYTNDKGETKYKTFVNATNMTFLQTKKEGSKSEENNSFKNDGELEYQLDVDDELPF